MAEKIEEQHSVKPQMIEGGGGIFDVVADGRLIFSKHQAGRFPEDDEVLTALEAT